MPLNWIANAQVLSADGDWHRSSVLIDGNRFAAVGSDLPVPDNADVIDGTGKWLIPGLIDAHVHLCSSMDSVRTEPPGGRQTPTKIPIPLSSAKWRWQPL